MPIDPNDFSINNLSLDSQFTAQEYQSRIVSNARGGRANVTQSIKNYTTNNAAKKTLRFPIDTPKYYLEMQIAKYDRANLFKLNFATQTTILLPLSNQIVDSDGVSYIEDAAGPLLGNLIQAGTSVGKNSTTNSENTATKQADLNQALKDWQDGKLSKEQLDSILRGIAPVAAGGVLQVAPNDLALPALGFLGYSPNQFFTVLMKGPMYKSYVFAWKLFPKNKQESDAIVDIVNTLQNAKAVTKELGGALWGFPNIFKLGYRPNTKYLHKFKPAVLEEINVDFSAGGTPAFYAGKTDNPPESVIIQAKFKEMEYWLKGDYTDNPDPFVEGGEK